MNIVLTGENFTLNLSTVEDDETQIEELIAKGLPLTPEIQAAINAKYGTLAERQARKAAGKANPMSLEALAARVVALEEELKALRNASNKA